MRQGNVAVALAHDDLGACTHRQVGSRGSLRTFADANVADVGARINQSHGFVLRVQGDARAGSARRRDLVRAYALAELIVYAHIRPLSKKVDGPSNPGPEDACEHHTRPKRAFRMIRQRQKLLDVALHVVNLRFERLDLADEQAEFYGVDFGHGRGLLVSFGVVLGWACCVFLKNHRVVVWARSVLLPRSIVPPVSFWNLTLTVLVALTQAVSVIPCRFAPNEATA